MGSIQFTIVQLHETDRDTHGLKIIIAFEPTTDHNNFLFFDIYMNDTC